FKLRRSGAVLINRVKISVLVHLQLENRISFWSLRPCRALRSYHRAQVNFSDHNSTSLFRINGVQVPLTDFKLRRISRVALRSLGSGLAFFSLRPLLTLRALVTGIALISLVPL